MKSDVGTPDYMAPEVHMCRREGVSFDRTADWWALGIILCEMMFGGPPLTDPHHRAEHTIRMIKKWRCYFPPPEWKDLPNVSDEAKDLIAKLICDKADRYRTGDEILRHPWFRDVDVKKIRDMKQYFVPKLDTDADVSNFDHFSRETLDTWEENKIEDVRVAASKGVRPPEIKLPEVPSVFRDLWHAYIACYQLTGSMKRPSTRIANKLKNKTPKVYNDSSRPQTYRQRPANPVVDVRATERPTVGGVSASTPRRTHRDKHYEKNNSLQRQTKNVLEPRTNRPGVPCGFQTSHVPAVAPADAVVHRTSPRKLVPATPVVVHDFRPSPREPARMPSGLQASPLDPRPTPRHRVEGLHLDVRSPLYPEARSYREVGMSKPVRVTDDNRVRECNLIKKEQPVYRESPLRKAPLSPGRQEVRVVDGRSFAQGSPRCGVNISPLAPGYQGPMTARVAAPVVASPLADAKSARVAVSRPPRENIGYSLNHERRAEVHGRYSPRYPVELSARAGLDGRPTFASPLVNRPVVGLNKDRRRREDGMVLPR